MSVHDWQMVAIGAAGLLVVQCGAVVIAWIVGFCVKGKQ
jgi:hypothetical protein